MLFKSAILTSASGSVGGMTASHNRGGMYFRARAIPVDPNSQAQQDARQALGDAGAGWKDLTQLQRDAWKTYAQETPVLNPLGDQKTLTGINWYVAMNAVRMSVGLSSLEDAPTFGGEAVQAVTGIAATDGNAEVDVTFNDTGFQDEDEGRLQIAIGNIVSPGVNFYKGPFKIAGTVDGSSTLAPTSPATVTIPFSLKLDDVIFVRSRTVREDGRYSPFRIDRVVVTE